MESQRPAWSRQTKLMIVAVLIVLFGLLLWRFGSVIPPLILAAMLAYGLYPLVRWVQSRLKIGRVLAILLVYLVLLLLILAVLMILLPHLTAEGNILDIDLQQIQQLFSLTSRQVNIAGYTVDLKSVMGNYTSSIQDILRPLFGGTLAFLARIVSSLAWVVFIIVISIYLIKDNEILGQWIEGLVTPGFRPDFIHLRDEINEVWGSFFRGQLLLMLVVMTLFIAVDYAIGLRFALGLGILAGLLEFFPSIGHGIWLITASIVAIFGGSTWIPLPNWAFMMILIGLHLIYEQFDLNYLIPRIVGRSLHLRPLVVILGIVVGATLAGVLGVVLAAPTIASLRVVGRYIYARLVDLEPFPGNISEPLPPPNPYWWRWQLRRGEPRKRKGTP